MTWTNDPPTAPGDYWWREREDSPREEWHVVRVAYRDVIVLCGRFPIRIGDHYRDLWLRVDDDSVGGEWLPIPSPDEIDAPREAAKRNDERAAHIINAHDSVVRLRAELAVLRDDLERASAECGKWRTDFDVARAEIEAWQRVADDMHAHVSEYYEGDSKALYDAAVARHTKGATDA